MTISQYESIIQYIQAQKPHFQPKVGLVLGSGLGQIAEEIQDACVISYHTIPGFPQSTVKGHQGRMVLGFYADVPVVCMQGRIHVYEGADALAFKIFIRTFKLLGCESIILTNAAGSLRETVGPGEICLMTDHINFQHRNPLVGANDDEFGDRFFAMDNAYDLEMRARFLNVAKTLNIPLHESIFAGVTGPCFETPAEIRAFRILGADTTAMSIIPEVIIARHCGLRVAGLSCITNFASGMTSTPITHEETLHYGKIGSINMSKLIKGFMESLSHGV